MHVVVLAVLTFLALWLSLAILLDAHGRQGQVSDTADAIVVLGCGVLPDGSPTGHLVRRVEKGVALWRQGLAPVVVMTGGGEPAEATATARHASDLGLPDSAVILEDRSRTTAENASFCAELMVASHVVVVTDSYHVPRSGWIFRRHFPRVETVGVIAPGLARYQNALREVLAIAWYLLRWIFGWVPRGDARP
jgi:uncharacterized SAM-binding protein YcdF (DUF218 family)